MGLDEFRTSTDSDNNKDSNSYSIEDKDVVRINESKNEESSSHEQCSDSYEPSEWLSDKLDQIGFKQQTKCDNCGETFARLSSHYRMSDCPYPDVKQQDKDLLIGMQMSDGYLRRHSEIPSMSWTMNNLPFIKWFSEILSIGTKQIYLDECAKRSYNNMSGAQRFTNTTEWSNYTDMYKSGTISHPYLSTLNWYTEDGKRFPDWLELNERIIKIWYCGDGDLNLSKNKNEKAVRLRLTVSNESDRVDMIKHLFKNYGLDLDNIWSNEYDGGRNGLKIAFGNEKSRLLLERLRPVVPGFEYKWCTESYQQYKKLKQLSRRTSSTDKEANEKLENFSLEKHKEKALQIGGFGGYK